MRTSMVCALWFFVTAISVVLAEPPSSTALIDIVNSVKPTGIIGFVDDYRAFASKSLVISEWLLSLACSTKPSARPCAASASVL